MAPVQAKTSRQINEGSPADLRQAEHRLIGCGLSAAH
jgi:hypothetical protein